MDCQSGEAGAECLPCHLGEFCAGGDQGPVDCEGLGGFDDDADPATACEPWTDCKPDWEERTPGTGLDDRVCVPPEWTVQHGKAGFDVDVAGAAVDAEGDLYIAGSVGRADGETDGLVYKLSGVDGSVLWEKRFGATDGSSEATGVGVSQDGGLLVSGLTNGSLISDNAAGTDSAFVRRMSRVDGEEKWTTEVAHASRGHVAFCVTSDDVAVIFTWDTGAAGVDANSGSAVDMLWPNYTPWAPSWVAGATCGGEGHAYTLTYASLPGGSLDVPALLSLSVRAQGVDWGADLSALIGGGVVRLVGSETQVDASVPSALFLAQPTAENLASPGTQGADDCYVARIAADGSQALWSVQFGTSKNDWPQALAPREDALLVAGHTEGALVGVLSGTSDGIFLRALAAEDGAHHWTRQWNTAGVSTVVKNLVDSERSVFLVGKTTGNFKDAQDLKANQQLFVMKVVP